MRYRSLTLLALFFSCGFMQRTFGEDETATTFARRASVAGMTGDSARKAELLEQALQADPSNALANWNLGRVAYNKEWLSLDDYEQKMATDSRLSAYHTRRDQLARGTMTELELADWCRRKGLSNREKLHLTNIWRSDSAAAEIRLAAARRLGMRNLGGVWMTPAEARSFQDSLLAARQNSTKWRRPTMMLIRELESRSAERRKLAIEKYRRGLDYTAVISLESLLSTRGEPFALLAVKLIGEMPEFEATESLVRHAIYVDSPKVREAAVERLKTREENDVVPIFLTQLSNPLEFGFGLSVGPDGMVRSTQQVLERGRDANIRYVNASARGIHPVNEVQVSLNPRGQIRSIANSDDSLVARRLAGRGFDSIEDRLTAEADIRKQLAMERQQLIQQEVLRTIGLNRALLLRNQQASVVNQRTIDSLTAIVGQKVEPATATGWWDWWNEQNDRYQAETPTYTRYVASSDPIRVLASRSCECFPAGTLVRTQTGLREIQDIMAGDEILSKNTESGQLDYKLVLATTKRPPSSMVRTQLTDGTIESTNGHLFWVEEQGWTMAKDLESGDLIHGLRSSQLVDSVESLPETEAFNLVVADFGTYFVGKQDILVHDNSERRRSNSVTPGVARELR